MAFNVVCYMLSFVGVDVQMISENISPKADNKLDLDPEAYKRVCVPHHI